MDLLFQFDNQPVAEASRSTPPKQPNKRLRTRRACDYCREHRIRCEYYDASETGACAHCENFGIPCQKIAEAPPDERPRAAKVTKTGAKEDLKGQSASPRNPTFNIAQEHTYLGPTSFSQQVHHHFSSTPLALDQLLAAEEKLGLASDVFQWAKGTGFLLGAGSQGATPLPSVSSPSTRPARASSVSSFSRANDRLADEIGGVTMINHLLLQAQTRIIPVFPVVSVHESLGSEDPTQEFMQIFVTHHPESRQPHSLPRATRIALCTLASMSREVSPAIRNSLLSAFNSAVDNHDFTTSSLSTVQLLLLLSVNDVLADKYGRPGQAVHDAARMGVEIALHRNISPTFAPIAQLHRRARVWGSVMIADRWCSVRQGQMPSLDLSHADAPLPFSYPDHVSEPDMTLAPCFAFHLTMARLAELLGRAYQMTGTPAGLGRSDDLKLLLWQRDYEEWVEGLPAHWPYSFCLETPEASSILSLLAVAVLNSQYTFSQPFFWPTAPIPANLTYRPPSKWIQDLQSRSFAAIQWVTTNAGQYYLDMWSMLIHPFLCCLLVQAKSLRSGDPLAAVTLDQGIQSVEDWAKHGKGWPLMHLPRDAILSKVQILKMEQALVFPWIPALMSKSFDDHGSNT